MNIKVKKIIDRGVIGSERIVFEVLTSDDLGQYMVFKSKDVGEGKVSSKIELTYWFPDKAVSAGDLVVLYTKAGTNTEQKNKDGSTSHFYYWGKVVSLWESKSSTVLLGKVDWSSL